MMAKTKMSRKMTTSTFANAGSETMSVRSRRRSALDARTTRATAGSTRHTRTMVPTHDRLGAHATAEPTASRKSKTSDGAEKYCVGPRPTILTAASAPYSAANA